MSQVGTDMARRLVSEWTQVREEPMTQEQIDAYVVEQKLQMATRVVAPSFRERSGKGLQPKLGCGRLRNRDFLARLRRPIRAVNGSKLDRTLLRRELEARVATLWAGMEVEA